MKGRYKGKEQYNRAMVKKIARDLGVSEQDVERVLRARSDRHAIAVRPERAITRRTIVKVCLWMVGILFAFIFLAVLMLVIAGR